jgi:hypothetical protein
MKPSRLRRVRLAFAAAVSVAVALAISSITSTPAEAATRPSIGPAVACQFSQMCSPNYGGANMRVGPYLVSRGVAWIPDITAGRHTGLFISCYAYGDNPGYSGGNWPSTNVWYMITWTEYYGNRYQGFINGGFIDTGGTDPAPGYGQCF